MFRVVFNSLLILTAIILFFVFTKPQYETSLAALREENSVREKAVQDSEALKRQLSKLQAEQSEIDPRDDERLRKILPDSVDPVYLIIEINSIANRYGMSVKSPKFTSKDIGRGGHGLQSLDTKPQGTFAFEFVVEGSYFNFVPFLKDLERNLRLLDITQVDFDVAEKGDTFVFRVLLNTYWLK